MASRKSAAKIKPIKGQHVYQEELPPIEELFDDAKQMYVMTVETNIITAKRIDNLMNIRDYAYKFWRNSLDNLFDDKQRLDYFKDLQKLSINVYEQIKEIAEGFTLEAFSNETIDDCFKEILPTPDDIEDEDELCRAGLIFLTVRPYADKMLKLHSLIRDELSKREPIIKSTLDGTTGYIEESEDMA